MTRGKIKWFYGTWGSGLGTLVVETEGGIDRIPCDNGPTVRALDAMFPGFIAEGHTVDNSVIEGQEIEYETDGLVLTALYPVE